VIWYRVTTPPFTCAFAVDEHDIIVDGAPIMRRWLGQSVHVFARWVRKSWPGETGFQALE
jgi:hypothetical protein